MARKNNLSYDDLRKFLKKTQSPARYEHGVRVGDLAAQLGKIHGWNKERARLAGLLHDCAKEWSPKKMFSFVRKNKLKVPDLPFVLKNAPNMMHAYVGSEWAAQKGWILNKSDLRAIRSHTLGEVGMSVEQKILFVADFAEPGRPYKSARIARKIAKLDLEEALRIAMAHKMRWQLRKSKPVHPFWLKVWNHLVAKP